LIRNVEVSTISQPTSDRPVIAASIRGSAICQITDGIGRHCQNSKTSARLANST
jgi:hypothetical protein